MKETQIKQINNSNNGLKQIAPKVEPNKQKDKKYETIKQLPTWSIEPPLEIKRGN